MQLASASLRSCGGFAAGILATAAALIYQHVIVRPGDLTRINTAFFTANGFVSVALAVCGIAAIVAIRRRHAGSPVVPIRWVLVRDPSGEKEPQAFLCTDLDADPVDVLRWFVRRWRVETTFEEARRHLGGADPRGI